MPFIEPEKSEVERLVEIKKMTHHLKSGQLNLEDVFEAIAHKHPNSPLHVFADQFEELYTRCLGEDERRRFLDELLSVCGSTSLTMIGHSEPFDKCGVLIEDGLTDRILDVVSSELGNLPLLEFALTQLWEKCCGRTLTHAAYDTIGGVEQALAGYADRVYESLNPEEQKRAVTSSGERSANFSLPEDKQTKVCTPEEVVEVVHEALLRGWQRLRNWMETNREFRMWQERLRTAMSQWKRNNYDQDRLLRGILPAEAEMWLNTKRPLISSEGQCFIESSVRVHKKSLFRKRIGMLTGTPRPGA